MAKVRYIESIKIYWEKFESRRPTVQCYRCQAHGHTSTNCNKTKKCVKCAATIPEFAQTLLISHPRALIVKGIIQQITPSARLYWHFWQKETSASNNLLPTSKNNRHLILISFQKPDLHLYLLPPPTSTEQATRNSFQHY